MSGFAPPGDRTAPLMYKLVQFLRKKQQQPKMPILLCLILFWQALSKKWKKPYKSAVVASVLVVNHWIFSLSRCFYWIHMSQKASTCTDRMSCFASPGDRTPPMRCSARRSPKKCANWTFSDAWWKFCSYRLVEFLSKMKFNGQPVCILLVSSETGASCKVWKHQSVVC